MKKKQDDELILYTVEELADLFKVTQRTIYNYISTGQLKGYKIATKWRFSKQNIQDFMGKMMQKEPAKYVKGTKKHYE